MKPSLARLLPPAALTAAYASIAAIAVVLFRVFGPLWPTMPTHWTVKTEHDAEVIAAGHDEEILHLIVHGADERLTASERLEVTDIQADGEKIVVRFAVYPTEQLIIRAASATDAAFLHTTVLAVSWSQTDVPVDVRRYATAMAAAPGWSQLWTAPRRDVPSHAESARDKTQSEAGAMTMPLSRTEHPLVKTSGSTAARGSERSVWLLILWLLIAGSVVATALLFLGRRRSASTGAATAVNAAVPPHLVTVTIAVMAVVVALVALAHFHFRVDDYAFLALATHYPTELTGETRILSTRVHYQLGVLLGGGWWWFAVSNLIALAAMCSCWGLLLRRAGFALDAAVIAAALLALGPGTFFLLRQANGIEHLSATTCLMLVLLLTDLAARERERSARWRAGVVVLALCWSVFGVLTKLPLMIVLPPTCWLWGRWLVERPAPPMHRSVTYLLFAAAVGGSMIALTRTSPSIGFLPSRWAFAAIGDRLARYTLAAIVLFLLGARLATATPVLRTRIGRVPLLPWAMLLSALWLIPFLLHSEYEGEAHYGLLASAPWSAVAAAFIAAAIEQRRGPRWRDFILAGVACAILLPLGEIRGEIRSATDELVPGWLDQIHGLTAALAPPAGIVVAPACASSFSPPLREQMNVAYGEIGVWWATGWYDVPVELRDDAVPVDLRAANTVTLGFCPGQRATVE